MAAFRGIILVPIQHLFKTVEKHVQLSLNFVAVIKDCQNINFYIVKSAMGMEEMQSSYQKPVDRSLAVAISDGTFAWHFTSQPIVKKDKKKKYGTFLN